VTGRNWNEAVERAATHLTARTGLTFPPHRSAELIRGLRLADIEGDRARDPERLVQRLESEPEVWERLLDQITIGETYFFREPEHFELVRREVLPVIVAERGPSPAVRVWSAGCASGEETYSLAIVLHQQGMLSRASVLGSDISRAAVSRAREGVYRSWSLRGADLAGLEPYFVVEADRFRISNELRARVRFEKINLAEPEYPSASNGTASLDLIFCRNVFIYLNADTIREVAARFFRALAPGGYLVLGPSDPLLLDAGFEVLTTRAGIAYRKPTSELPVVATRPVRFEPEAPAVPVFAPRPSFSLPDEVTPPSPPPEPAAVESVEEIRALANQKGAVAAERACSRAIEAAPLSVELHYLQGLMLLELGDHDNAVSALKRALYLDADLAIAHFTLGSLLSKVGDRRGAERAFRNAQRCARKTPSEEPLPLSDGLLAGGLARAAERELGLIDEGVRGRQ